MSTSKSNTPSTAGVRDAAADTAATLRDTVHDAAGKMSAEVSDAADKARSGAAQEVKDMADALHSAADQLDEGTSQRRIMDKLAGNLDHLSDALHDKSLGDMMGQLNDLARRNPLMFLGGAAMLGFAATRLATASTPDGTSSGSGSRSGASGGTRSASSSSGRDQHLAPVSGASATSRGA
jgi:hypothetical protein